MSGASFLMPDAFAAFGVRVADGAMTAGGSNPRILSSATAVFTNHDVGKKVTVAGAGAAGADLTTRIARRISATQVELDAPALTTVAGANVSYVKGVYRLSSLLAGPDVDGNRYQVISARRLEISLSSIAPAASKLFIGGPFVTPTNHGKELDLQESTDFSPGTAGLAVASSDYLTSATANQIVNVLWADDLNLSTPA